MRKHPKYIETEDKEMLEIQDYSNGKFWIASRPPMIYNIEKDEFYQIINGKELKADTLPRYPDMHKLWLKQKKRQEREFQRYMVD